MEKTEGKCKACLVEKQHKEVIDMGASKALELVHVKICDLTRTPSLSGARYLFSFC
jgi:hypothetical protein